MRTGLLRAPGGHPATWVATGRSGGVSVAPYASLNLAGHVGDDGACVEQNLERVARAAGAHAWAVADAVHGADVAVVTAPGIVTGVDALVTSVPGLALVALGADCVDVALASGASVAVAHAGWTGVVVGVIPAVVAALRESSGVADAVAIIGPSVCGRCYPVPDERIARVRRECEVADRMVVTAANGQQGLDVAAGVLAQLADLDVQVVWHDKRCTREHDDLFSYRRDGRTGRQGVAVCLGAAEGEPPQE